MKNQPTPCITSKRGIPAVLRFSGIWLILAIWCQIAGWLLSWFGSLTTYGYAAISPFALLAALFFWRATRPAKNCSFSVKKWLRRAKTTPALIAWVLVTVLIFIGATINPPSNYDGVTYRLPRLLYWIQENRWHWIDGLDHRQNISGVGVEWMSVPFILFTHSDRGLFLINFLPFLLLPGLFYVAAVGLGIGKKSARWWMWVWPMAYGIALQAGSIGNDMVVAALALLSIAFAAQARHSRPFLCLVFSALAAAAMTGVKATSLPLGLPIALYWAWVAYNALPWSKMFAVILSAAPAAIPSSFLPIAIACTIHTGVWSGNPGNRHGAEPLHPVAGLVGNAIEFGLSLVQPPVLPASGKINQSLKRIVDGQSWYQWTKKNYACFGIMLGNELPSEETAGLGFGITMVIFCWLIFASRGNRLLGQDRHLYQTAWIVATVIAILAFMAKAGMGGISRLILPYIPFFLLSILMMNHKRSIANGRISRALQIVPAVFLLPSLFLNPNRPVIPATLLFTIPGMPDSFRNRMESVYAAYQRRSNILAPLQEVIPQGEIIGFAGGGDHSALGLFKPYGTRKVLNLSPRTESKLNWVVALPESFERRMGVTLEQWEQEGKFEKVKDINITSRTSDGQEKWHAYKRIVGSK